MPRHASLLAKLQGDDVADGSDRLRDLAFVGRGMQPAHVRQMNMRAILGVISMQPAITNAELSRLTQLAPQTVSAVLLDLEEDALITRGEVLRGRRGQPATPLFLNPDGAFAIGAEIGLTHIDVALVGLGNQVVSRYRRDYEAPRPEIVLGELESAIGSLTSAMSNRDKRRLQGLAIAVPGGVDDPDRFSEGRDLGGAWASLDLGNEAARLSGMDVMMVSDGNAACWAERTLHPAPRPLNLLYLLIGPTLAAGIVAENRLWEGLHGDSTRLGLMLVADREGAPRLAQDVSSVSTLERYLRGVSATIEEAEAGTTPAAAAALDRWVDDCAFALAQVIVNTATVLDHESAIVDSVLPRSITKRIVTRINESLESIPTVPRDRSPVVVGREERPDPAKGAALLKMYRRHFSRDPDHVTI
jgi:predicted NBD/HSP70 family sugar kinase